MPAPQRAGPWAKWSFEETGKDTIEKAVSKSREYNKCREKIETWGKDRFPKLPWGPDNLPVPHHMYLLQ